MFFEEEFFIFEEGDPLDALSRQSPVRLRPPQLNALAAYQYWIENIGNAPLIVKATGTGKALVIASLPCTRMLVLAHRDRLCEQLFETIRWARPYLKVGMEKAEQTASPYDDVVVASVQTLGAIRETKNHDSDEIVKEITRRLRKWDKNHFDVIVIDEAHHALAASYVRIAQYFGAGRPGGPVLCGLTATPFPNSSGNPLSNVFDEHNGLPCFKYTIEDATNDGWLCDLEYRRVRTDVDISDLQPSGDDLDPTKLSKKINIDVRNSKIISAVEKHAEHRKSIIVFAADIEHAEELQRQFDKRGHEAAVVHYKIPKQEQKDILKRFEQQDIRILINVAILTEGVDLPRTDCLVFSRPTRSLILLSQMLGRGTRNICPKCASTHFEVRRTEPFEWYCNSCNNAWGESERKTCLVLDFVDLIGQLDIKSAMELFEAREVDLLGQPIRKALPVIREADDLGIVINPDDNIEQVRERVERFRGLADKTIYIDTHADAVDLFESVKRVPVDQHTIFPWQKLGGDRFLLFGPKGERMGVWKNDLGEWWVGKKGEGKQRIGVRSRAPWATIDKKIKSFLKEKIPVGKDWEVPAWRMIHSNVKWRKGPVKDYDRRRLTELGVKKIPSDINAGAARDMINLLTYQAKRKSNGKNLHKG